MTENTHDPAELQLGNPNASTAGEDAPPAVDVSTAPGTFAVPAGEDVTPAQGTGDPSTPADVGASPAGVEGDPLDQADDDDDQADPSAGMAGVDVTLPNPYAGPLGYVGKFATDRKAITDSEAPDELDAGPTDELTGGAGDQLDHEPPA